MHFHGPGQRGVALVEVLGLVELELELVPGSLVGREQAGVLLLLRLREREPSSSRQHLVTAELHPSRIAKIGELAPAESRAHKSTEALARLSLEGEAINIG